MAKRTNNWAAVRIGTAARKRLNYTVGYRINLATILRVAALHLQFRPAFVLGHFRLAQMDR